MEKVNLAEKFAQFSETWSPKLVGRVNEMDVRLVRLRGEFVWHHHEHEDEMFFVVSGRLLLKFRDREVWLDPGEFIIIPRGTEHLPVAEDDVQVMLFESSTTLNTGNVVSERTVAELQRL